MSIRRPFAVVPLPLTNISTNNERANRPASHLGLPQYPGMRWQTNGFAPVAFVRGQFGGTLRAVNFASLMATNAQPGTTFRIKLGTSQADVDSFMPTYDSGDILIRNPAQARADGLYHAHVEIPVVHNVSWWRIEISGPHVGDFSASALILGERREPARFYNRDREVGFEDIGTIEIARNGVVAETGGALLRTLLFRLQWVSDSEWWDVWSPLMTTKGRRQVLFWCFDPQLSARRQDLTFLGYMSRDLFKRGNDFPKDNQVDFQIRAFDFTVGANPVLPINQGIPESALTMDFAADAAIFVRRSSDLVAQPRAFSSFVTFTRGSTATRINAAGQVEVVGNNVPRIDFDPVTLQPRGLLMEGQRTNLLLNSLINGTNLTTQSVTVTAAAHTLSFYGTGTVVLSGAHAATVVGGGAYPARTTLTFTPSAGTLTLTVTGTVQFAQLEAGAFASSYIPTSASQVTRVADSALVTGANFSDWYNQAEGTFLVEGISRDGSGSSILASVSDGTNSNRHTLTAAIGAAAAYANVTGGVVQGLASAGGGSTGVVTKRAFAYSAVNSAFTRDGNVATQLNTPLMPAVNRLSVGAVVSTSGSSLNIRRIRYWPARLTNAQLQELTA